MGSVLSFNGDLPLRCRVRTRMPYRDPHDRSAQAHGLRVRTLRRNRPTPCGAMVGIRCGSSAGFEPWCFYKVQGCGTAFGFYLEAPMGFGFSFGFKSIKLWL